MKSLMFILVLTCSIMAQVTSPTYTAKIDGFRESKWQSNFNEVKSKETSLPAGSFNSQDYFVLKYKGEILNKRAEYYYLFKNDKLCGGVYQFNELYLDDEKEYLEDFDNFKEMLISQYGEPSIEEWSTDEDDLDLYKTSEEMIVKAIQIGELILKIHWQTNEGEIILELSSKNGISNKLYYLSNKKNNEFEINYLNTLLK